MGDFKSGCDFSRSDSRWMDLNGGSADDSLWLWHHACGGLTALSDPCIFTRRNDQALHLWLQRFVDSGSAVMDWCVPGFCPCGNSHRTPFGGASSCRPPEPNRLGCLCCDGFPPPSQIPFSNTDRVGYAEELMECFKILNLQYLNWGSVTLI